MQDLAAFQVNSNRGMQVQGEAAASSICDAGGRSGDLAYKQELGACRAQISTRHSIEGLHV